MSDPEKNCQYCGRDHLTQGMPYKDCHDPAEALPDSLQDGYPFKNDDTSATRRRGVGERPELLKKFNREYVESGKIICGEYGHYIFEKTWAAALHALHEKPVPIHCLDEIGFELFCEHCEFKGLEYNTPNCSACTTRLLQPTNFKRKVDQPEG